MDVANHVFSPAAVAVEAVAVFEHRGDCGSVVSVDREPFKVEESFLRDSRPVSRSVFLRFSVPGACSSWVWISSTTVWIRSINRFEIYKDGTRNVLSGTSF